MPVAIAARGMPSYLARLGSCANVMPPAALISRSPERPSDAVPESTTPIARSAPARGERAEEEVDRHVLDRVARARQQVQPSVVDAPSARSGGIT